MTAAAVPFGAQPEARAGGADPVDAVVSWHYVDGVPRVVCRFGDPTWVGAPVGGLAAATVSMRSIDFERLPAGWAALAKRALYGAYRHPHRINMSPAFATLIKKWQALRRYFTDLHERGVDDVSAASAADTGEFLRGLAARCGHIETVVSQIGAIREVNSLAARGHLSFRIPLAEGHRGATAMAGKIWREVHGEDFRSNGYEPFEDEDAALIVRAALFYIRTLAPPILDAFAACNAIALRHPKRRFDRSEEGLCYRAQMAALAAVDWPAPDAGYRNWPPSTAKELRTHVRLLSASCAIVLLFALGCRRSEIIGADEECLTDEGEDASIKILYRKGEHDLEGRLVALPACAEVADAVRTQLRVKQLLRANTHGFAHPSRPHGKLFAAVRYRHFFDLDGRKPQQAYRRVYEAAYAREAGRGAASEEAEGGGGAAPEGEDVEVEGGPLTNTALNAFLRDFKRYVVPDVTGPLSPHRFRKTAARLIVLSMEGSPLILQQMFGQASYFTTLEYMFASPFIQDELVEGFPELAARNLAALWRARDGLGGGGADLLRRAVRGYRGDGAAALNGDDTGMTEEEFVELGLRMVKDGHMILSILGPGMYCLKPVAAAGLCNRSEKEVMPNLRRCRPACRHHLQTEEGSARMRRAVKWAKRELARPGLSASMRKAYTEYLEDLRGAAASGDGIGA